METLGETGEIEAIRRLTMRLGTHPQLRVGAGDDCAVVAIPGSADDQVFTTDPVIEQVHFLPGEQPERIGRKAAGRVLSDMAAMGAQPQWMLVNLVAPPTQRLDALEAVYAGMTEQCSRFGAVIIGGDLAQGPVLELHVFGAGRVPAGTARLRSGARAGDALLVTGRLGVSRSGRHLDFIPRVEEGIFLRESGAVNAMMDISDGLATDLRHILGRSGAGARLDADRIPSNGTLGQALFDGEDFELLLTVPPDRVDELLARWNRRFDLPLSVIGSMTAQPGVLEIRRNGRVERLDARAFEHFTSPGGRG